MGIFSRVAAMMAGGAGRVGAAMSGLRSLLNGITNPELRREAAFAIAMIALSAKMAKADGVVSRSEVDAFCRIFSIPAGEERNVSRVYNLAKRDVAGFDSYARDVARRFADDPAMLEAVLDGLFDIARADGAVHERELNYLSEVSGIFGFDAHMFETIRARHTIGGDADPYVILGANRSWDYRQLRRHYRQLVAENHPDRLMAHGVPPEFARIANDRLSAINAAWDQIERARVSA